MDDEAEQPRKRGEYTGLARYKTWSTKRRYAEAVRKVLHEDWSQSEAARAYGLTRGRLNEKVRDARKLTEENREKLAARSTEPAVEMDGADPLAGMLLAARSPLGLREQRRVGTFEDFDAHYWSSWVCPDCHEHHQTPGFHRSIIQALEEPHPRVLINLPPFHAKHLSLNTPIPTPAGWSTIGELVVGDEVFDKDGHPCRVVGLSPVTACDTRVQLGGANGPEFLTSGPHRWWVEFRDANPRFVTTAEVAAAPEARRFRVPVNGGLDLPDADLPIAPYTLGAWLGDGFSAGDRVCGLDDGVFTEIERDGYVLGVPRGMQATGFHRRGVVGLQAVLRSMSLLNNKHIPAIYLRASAAQRLALLQGIMDTDGTVTAPEAGSSASFSTVKEHLAEQVHELVSSLGWKARTCKGPAMLNGVDCGVHYRVIFNPERECSPFRLERKTDKLPEKRTQVGHWPFTKVEPLEAPVLGRCIAVDSPTETFLCGRDMVPSGNSTLVTVKHTIYQIVKDPNHRTIIISKSLPFARTFLHSINQLLTNPELYGPGPSIINDWGPFNDGGDIWNTESIYVSGRVTAEKDPTVQVLGAMGQVYGRRADTIKCDDIATLDNQRNPARVQQMLTWLDQEVSSRIGRNGKLVYVGTRVHPGDVYSWLKDRPGYKVLRFPLVLDDTNEETLWPEHFTYDMALAKKSEMREADFQLVYQNIDIPGLGASFTPEMLNEAKDKDRANGHYESPWRLIAGLDLAGGGASSGYTAGVLMGIDLRTGKRFLVDHFNVKSMRAPQLKDQIFDWTDRYPIYEWRVENNGLQANLVQYNEEIIRVLASRGVRVVGHNTHNNKWDAEFGVESMAPLYAAGMLSIPWGNSLTSRHWQQLIDQLIAFPMGVTSDLVMAHWFADLGCRDLLKRAHLPMFNERMHVPERIRKRRRVVDFAAREVRGVKEWETTRAGAGVAGYRRMTVGTPTRHEDVRDPDPAAIVHRRYVNRDADVPEND